MNQVLHKPEPPRFIEQDSLQAYNAWGANCGPHALAVALDRTLDEVRPALIGFDLKRYTNPTMMENAINTLFSGGFERRRGLRTQSEIPAWGLARVQWEGRWLDPGVPKMVAYRHTHWIACGWGHVFCTVFPTFGWHPFPVWSKYVTDWCPHHAYRGWHITHHYSVDIPF